MTREEKDTARVLATMLAVVDGRDPATDFAAIMVTLEGSVAGVLLALMQRNPAKAAGMLNEGLVPGVEQRLAMVQAKDKKAPS